MDYTVDPDQLRIVVRGLENVQAAMVAMGSLAEASGRRALDPAVVGDIGVVAALIEVGGNWSRARARIRAEVEGAAHAVEAAARSYAGVESGLVAALAP